MKKPKEFRVLSPTGILGYGFPLDSFERGIAAKPNLLAVDGGSVDPGPYYLGAGKSFTTRAGVKRDLRLMVVEGVERRIPVCVGSAGGCGAKPHVEWCLDILDEIAREEKLSFKLGVIWGDVPKDRVSAAIKTGNVTPLAGLPALTEETLRESRGVVAQMGVDPFIRAFKAGCDVVIAGRAYDPAVFAALPISLGFDPGLAIHMGKILECAAIAADPGSGADCVLGTLRDDHFELSTLSDERAFTPDSVAAHSLYEKSDPYRLPGPGGHLDLTDVSFEKLPGGKVKVSGSRFVKSEANLIKLEGVQSAGFRTISVAGVRDPLFIDSLDAILEEMRKRSADLAGDIHFHVYGKDGVMGRLEPTKTIASHEIGIVMEAVASSQEQADVLCGTVRSTLLHYGYPGRVSTAGNLAFPFSPSDLSAGETFEFSIYHLMEADENELFKLETREVGR